jgi:aerobic-type carbon monoxide dehydrogenase small subunit (CoxS/CutS family)
MDPRLTLLDALLDVLGLTGTKKGCDRWSRGHTASGPARVRGLVLSGREQRSC